MKTIFFGLMTLSLGLMFVSCEKDDTDFSDIIAEYQVRGWVCTYLLHTPRDLLGLPA